MRRAAFLFVLLLASSAAAEDLYLSPISFRPTSSGSDYGIDQGGLGCLRMQRGSGFFLAVVPLEPGVEIEAVTALVEDTNADALAMVSLARRRETAFEVVAMSPASVGGNRVEELIAKPTSPVKPESGAAYLVQVMLSGPDVCLHGVRVALRAT